MTLKRATESEILPSVLVAVTAMPDTCAWRTNSGVFLSPDGKRRVRANVPGCGDVTGCKAVTITADMVGQTIGVAFSIETKTLKGDQRTTQENFQRRWQKAGGIYILARSADDVVRVLA